MSARKGSVTLVGAGLGDPELLTIKAARMLAEADVVVADRLVPQPILDLVKGELVVSTKAYGTADEAQAILDATVVEHALAGRSVVRLKGGDPSVFGRGGEEVLRYAELGVHGVRLVPGVSSATSAAGLAGIPLTMRGVADRFLVCTATGKGGAAVDLPAFIPTQTLVLLMGVRRLSHVFATLVDMGYPPTLPAAIICRASSPHQTCNRGTLTTLPAAAAAAKLEPPAIIVVGHVVDALPEGALSK